MISDGARTVLRIGGGFLVLAGLIALVFAARPPGSVSGRAPVAVQAGQAVHLPRPALFGAGLTLYGTVESGADAPSARDLGCTVTKPGGVRGYVGGMAWVDHKPQTVRGQSLTAMVSISRYPTGSTLTCDGDAASTVEPMYLLGGGLDTGLMRVMLVGFAVVALVVGAVAVIVLRPRT